MKVLIIEDDDAVVGALSAVLLHHGFQLAVARSAGRARALLDPSVDVVLLDLGLPDQDGMKLCAYIGAHSDAALIIVTARDDIRSRVHGLDAGADDYIVKPYDSRELLARLNAAVRGRMPRRIESPQRSSTQGDRCSDGRLVVDVERHRVEMDGSTVDLTRREYEIVCLLARQPGIVVRYEQIISELWQTPASDVLRTLQVHMTSIRQKFGSVDVIETVRGIGYRLRD